MSEMLVYVAAIAVVAAVVVLLVARLRERGKNERLHAVLNAAKGLLETPASEIARSGGDEIDLLSRLLSAAATEKRVAVDRLQVEAARRTAILSSMVEGVLAVDQNLSIIFANEAMLRAVGWRRPMPERLALIEFVRDSDLLAMVAEVIRTGDPSKRSMRIGAASGRSYEIYAAPLEGGRGAIAIFHDITDLERSEQVRKDFVANVSHEMRTPLASIIAYSETLLEGALDDEAVNRRFVEVIRSNAIRLNNISTDLLTLSDLESGGRGGEMERVPVHEVVESALRTVEPEARANGIEIVRGEMEELFVSGRRLRLEQAVLNLLANALKFNRAGGEVRACVARGEGGSVRVEIADTGLGIPSEDLPRIFERFYRVDKARSREVGGTGLGLSIVKHVVEAMNGRVGVESQLGKGSRFTITLPAG